MRTSQFFEAWFGGSSAGALVVFSPGKNAAIFPLSEVGAFERAEAKALELSNARYEVYFGCCLVDDKEVLHGRGKASKVVCVPGAWIDIDCHAPYRKVKLKDGLSFPPTEQDIIQLLWEALPDDPPTFIVRSGAGIHAYWLDACAVATKEEREAARDGVERLQACVRAKAAEKGWHVDKTSDLSRVLRPPGTQNWRDPAGPKLVDFVRNPDGSIWRGPAFNRQKWCAPPAAPKPEVVVDPEVVSKPRVKLKDGDTVAAYALRCMLRASDPEKKKSAELLAAGQPFAPDGDRNNTAYMLASAAAWYALEVKPDVTAEDLLPLFVPSLKAWAGDTDFDPTNPPPDEEVVSKQLESSIVDAAPKRAEKWAQEDRTNAVFNGMADKVIEAHKAAKAAEVMKGAASRDFRERIAKRTPAELAQGYTEEDIAAFAKQQGCTVEEFTKRWIIQCGNTYWVYVNGRYETPVPGTSIGQIIHRYLAPANLVLWVPKVDGDGIRKKKLEEILEEYGTPVFRVESSLHLQHSYLEPDAGVYHEAVCPVRDDLDPLFTSAIDLWFRAISGENYEQFLDYLATLPRLERQTCALYLHGPKGTGKSMLAQGLARIWTKYGPPTELEVILKGFNEALTKCPLVFADEQLPRIHGRKIGSSELKGHIATSSRTLNRKHISASNLSGCIRLILAANNDRMLIDFSEENLTHDDLEATVEKFLVIHAGEAAREYIQSIGGYAGTEAWVKDDLIARHVLWLSLNRPVRLGSRFLVQGKMTAVHAAAMTTSGIRGALCDFAVGFVLQPHKAKSLVGKRLLCGNGKVLMATTAVCEAWEHYVKYGKRPSTTLVGTQLKSLSHCTRKIRVGGGERHTYHDVKVDQLLAWAANNGDDGEEIMNRIKVIDASWNENENEEGA